MAKFLNTSAINYYLEEMIKGTRERLIVISPFLKFNDRIKELLTDKDRMKIDVRLVYGKSELAPNEINWLRSLEFVRTSFCQNLHAKCYVNEQAAIITSMNLYDFSQVNNNEMGVYIEREHDADLYRDTYEEAQRLIRVSEQVRLAAEKVDESKPKVPVQSTSKPNVAPAVATPEEKPSYDKLTSSKMARALGMKTHDFMSKIEAKGWIEKNGDDYQLTAAGQAVGGEHRISKQFGPFFLWPKDLSL
jgi:phosphatidylserine/phosphatidylglycerophosphate/cardiolipin synthase-like enzyme